MKEQCLKYFTSSSVWRKLFVLFREKYQSYGYFTGKVYLTDLTRNEMEVLEGFFEKSFHGQKSITVSAKAFEKALCKSRYMEYSGEDVLKLFFGEEIKSKKELENSFASRREMIETALKEKIRGSYSEEIFNELLEFIKPASISNITSVSDDEQNGILEEWLARLELGIRIADNLPYHTDKNSYIAVFAAKLTGNPHSFDAGTSGGQLLDRIVRVDLFHRGIEIKDNNLFKSYKKQRSYLACGLLIDDASNYAMLYGTVAMDGDEPHQGTVGFCQRNEMMQIPLSVMMKWEKIVCPDNEIIIVENPSVYAMLCAGDEGTRAYMCMNGQPRLAGIVALDLLYKAGTRIYYAGDLDPEGLLIGQRLADYYKGRFSFINMTADDYMTSKSDETISSRRIKILDNITHPALIEVAKLIKEHKKAGYQELVKQLPQISRL